MDVRDARKVCQGLGICQEVLIGVGSVGQQWVQMRGYGRQRLREAQAVVRDASEVCGRLKQMLRN